MPPRSSSSLIWWDWKRRAKRDEEIHIREEDGRNLCMLGSANTALSWARFGEPYMKGSHFSNCLTILQLTLEPLGKFQHQGQHHPIPLALTGQSFLLHRPDSPLAYTSVTWFISVVLLPIYTGVSEGGSKTSGVTPDLHQDQWEENHVLYCNRKSLHSFQVNASLFRQTSTEKDTDFPWVRTEQRSHQLTPDDLEARTEG